MTDPVTTAAVVAVASQVVGGLIGNLAGASDRRRMRDMINQAYAELEAIGLPPDLSKAIIYQEFQSQGIYTPTLEQDLGDIGSEWQKYEENKEYSKAEQDALSLLKQKSTQGLTPQDRVAAYEITENLNNIINAQNQRVLNEFRERRMGGSGAEIAATLGAGQQGINQASKQAMELAAMADKARLDAILGLGNLASQYQSAEFQRKATQNEALDALARFNAQNKRQLQSTNVGLLNQAQRENLAAQQAIANANVELANRELYRQREEEGRYWDRAMGLAQSKANAKLGQAGMYNADAQRQERMWSGIGQAVGTGAQVYGNYKLQQDYLNRAYPDRSITQESPATPKYQASPYQFKGNYGFETGQFQKPFSPEQNWSNLSRASYGAEDGYRSQMTPEDMDYIYKRNQFSRQIP